MDNDYNYLMSKFLELSVHALVDFVLRTGDIDSRVFNNETMMEGTRRHLLYQRQQNEDYYPEVTLDETFTYKDYSVRLYGRADGIIIQNNKVTIDEIKSTVSALDEFYEKNKEWHLGQAICYAYLYVLSHEMENISVRLTYLSQLNDDKLIKSFTYYKEFLKESVEHYLEEYLKFHELLNQHIIKRNKSAEELAFPYGEFRSGQKNLASKVYAVCKNGGTLYFEAPTGTGKTISTLFPAIKTFPLNENAKIFYLSAKSQAKDVAYNACKKMVESGLDIRVLRIASKDNMCQCNIRRCNPDECIYAKDYYTKLKNALLGLMEKNSLLNEDDIVNYATHLDMCPFELQLDYSLLCDVIICDYNYLFDPLVYLKRFFENNTNPYFALIDEAHNLAERSLSMYSASLKQDDFMLLKKLISHYKVIKFKKRLKEVINLLDGFKSDETYRICDEEFDEDKLEILNRYFQASQDILKNHKEVVNEQFDICFRQVYQFIKKYEFYNDAFNIFFDNSLNTLHLRCLDASSFLKKTIKKIRGGIFFSATLTPINYFMNRLGGSEIDPNMKLPSPFDKDRFLLLVRGDISTRYKDRDKSYKKIALAIENFINARVGNYLIFFPSYQYMHNVIEMLNLKENVKIIVQEKEMERKDKDIFLNQFMENPTSTTLGFAVLGGSFSEGIDLPQDRLIGAVVVGVGLPLICFERDLIKNYYNNNEEDGFDYAYTNPGMNKVLQAAGRVIRTKDDVGAVLLIDDRFLTNKYKSLFKVEWSNYRSVFNDEEMNYYLNSFWSKW